MKLANRLFKQFISVILLFLVCCKTTDSSNGNNDEQNTPLDGEGGGYIAFQSERHGPKEALYIMNADGSNQTKISTARGDYWPSWGEE